MGGAGSAVDPIIATCQPEGDRNQVPTVRDFSRKGGQQRKSLLTNQEALDGFLSTNDLVGTPRRGPAHDQRLGASLPAC
jgi:hypothetical protein